MKTPGTHADPIIASQIANAGMRAVANRDASGGSAALYRFRRAELEARIEELIALLDMIDGDADLEDNGDDEPSVSSPIMRGRNGEAQHDLEDDCECEPSLGWDESVNQCAGNRFGPLGSYDLEADTGRIFGGCGL